MAAMIVSNVICCVRRVKPTPAELLKEDEGGDDEARPHEGEYRHGPCRHLDSEELLGG